MQIDSFQILPFGCLITLILSIIQLICYIQPVKLICIIFSRFHQAYFFNDSEIQTISIKELTRFAQQEEFSLPCEAEYIKSPPLQNNCNQIRRRKSSVPLLPSTDLYLNNIRKKNKQAMKNSWKRQFYFPHRDFIILNKTKGAHENIDIDYTKLVEKYSKTTTKRKFIFVKSSLPTILEYEIY